MALPTERNKLLFRTILQPNKGNFLLCGQMEQDVGILMSSEFKVSTFEGSRPHLPACVCLPYLHVALGYMSFVTLRIFLFGNNEWPLI
jgi:hypothetical protein